MKETASYLLLYGGQEEESEGPVRFLFEREFQAGVTRALKFAF